MTAAANNNRRASKLSGERGEITNQQWRKIKRRSQYRCLRCGRKEPEIKLTIDHVVPLSRGGSNTQRNIQALCEECNQAKGDTIADYRKHPRKRRTYRK